MNSHKMIVSPVVAERKKLDIRAGDTVKVWQKIQEKGKTRLQLFDGIVLAVKHGKEAGGTFTVRKVASGVGVEKIFPIFSPMIDKIEVVKRSKVRKSKLYHIRNEATKEIKRQMRNTRLIKVVPEDVVTDEAGAEAVAEVVA
ncbi:50S ribosomal protein L19 [Candidatus Parcubacteria bacterium]|nr:50S ribosomal protein L19 [Candidatus Parcubacteria bacterium]